jgi:alpha-L-fucosidase 2
VMAVKRSMNPSLITSHEPNAGCFNTDGNGGIPHIANTMLMQSRVQGDDSNSRISDRSCEIDLLPALPKAWPDGKVTGLLARGGFTVDIEWKDGKVTNYRIASAERREVKLRVNGETKTVLAEDSEAVSHP